MGYNAQILGRGQGIMHDFPTLCHTAPARVIIQVDAQGLEALLARGEDSLHEHHHIRGGGNVSWNPVDLRSQPRRFDNIDLGPWHTQGEDGRCRLLAVPGLALQQPMA